MQNENFEEYMAAYWPGTFPFYRIKVHYSASIL